MYARILPHKDVEWVTALVVPPLGMPGVFSELLSETLSLVELAVTPGLGSGAVGDAAGWPSTEKLARVEATSASESFEALGDLGWGVLGFAVWEASGC